MIDPISALGAASSVVGIASFGIQLSQALYQYISDARDYKLELNAIVNGVRSATDALEMIRDLLETENQHICQHGQPILFTEKALMFVQEQGDQSLLLFWRIENEITKRHGSEALEEHLARRLDEYHNPKTRNQGRTLQLDPDMTLSTKGRITWPLVLPKLKDYRTQLEQHQINLSLMLQVIQFASLQKTMKKRCRQEKSRQRENREKLIAQIQETAGKVHLPILGQDDIVDSASAPEAPESKKMHGLHRRARIGQDKDHSKSRESLNATSSATTARENLHQPPSGLSAMVYVTQIPGNNFEAVGENSMPNNGTKSRVVNTPMERDETPIMMATNPQLSGDDSSTESEVNFIQREPDYSTDLSSYAIQALPRTEKSPKTSSSNSKSEVGKAMVSDQSAVPTTSHSDPSWKKRDHDVQITSSDGSNPALHIGSPDTEDLAGDDKNSSRGINGANNGFPKSRLALRQLTTYSAYTMNTKKKPTHDGKNSDKFIQEHVSQDQIIERIEKLNKGPSALAKKLKLLREQQEQIDSLLTMMLKQEQDRDFIWLLAQFETSISRLSITRRPSSITAYLSREPAPSFRSSEPTFNLVQAHCPDGLNEKANVDINFAVKDARMSRKVWKPRWPKKEPPQFDPMSFPMSHRIVMSSSDPGEGETSGMLLYELSGEPAPLKPETLPPAEENNTGDETTLQGPIREEDLPNLRLEIVPPIQRREVHTGVRTVSEPPDEEAESPPVSLKRPKIEEVGDSPPLLPMAGESPLAFYSEGGSRGYAGAAEYKVAVDGSSSSSSLHVPSWPPPDVGYGGGPAAGIEPVAGQFSSREREDAPGSEEGKNGIPDLVQRLLDEWTPSAGLAGESESGEEGEEAGEEEVEEESGSDRN
ncbi:hypothetical protein BP6252_12086 [Coleophoma cylindrospora]|uniref:Fungal N-terminal domain-containing protein n=1 Tax=Coleophoma cylindrospora TaxID=1849047 RepID=A0A3D8QFU0_9HELO|nr:hypothetical protein BP6252_12086 [Coleophoma cylindrospora]